MHKKLLMIIGIVGTILFIAGLIFNPNILAKFSSANVFHSDWGVTKIHLIRHYIIILGLVLILGSIIISMFPTEKRTILFIIGACVIGIIITIAGFVFSPSYVVQNFSSQKFLSDDILKRLLVYQLIGITLGCLVTFGSLFILGKRMFNSLGVYNLVIIMIGIVSYFLLTQITYFRIKYPSNIILKSSEYHKVLQLLLGQDILLSDFEPRSTLKVKRKQILKAKYPVIDMNFHLSSNFQTEYDRKILSPDNLIKSMDSIGVKIIVNTDAGNGRFDEILNRYARKYPDRFINFWPTGFPPGINTEERLASLPGMLESAIKMGAAGEGELWKNLGLKARDVSGKVIPVDDPRVDPLWAKAGELGVPVLWHMGDPASFFQPVNRFNERYEELRKSPNWSFFGSQFPSRDELLKQRENVLRKHPKTIFIGCHLGYNPENLEYVGYLLDTYPNYYVEMSSVLSDLGRQPYTARRFFIKYQDRILFATDGGNNFGEKGWTIEKYYRTYFEFLETDNEYFDYPLFGIVNQGNWKIYGINLPDEVLEKIYYKNSEKILFQKNLITEK